MNWYGWWNKKSQTTNHLGCIYKTLVNNGITYLSNWKFNTPTGSLTPRMNPMPSRSLTARNNPKKKLPFHPIGKDRPPTTIFQGRAVKLRGFIQVTGWLDWIALGFGYLSLELWVSEKHGNPRASAFQKKSTYNYMIGHLFSKILETYSNWRIFFWQWHDNGHDLLTCFSKLAKLGYLNYLVSSMVLLSIPVWVDDLSKTARSSDRLKQSIFN